MIKRVNAAVSRLSSPNSEGLMHSQMALVHVGHPRRTRGMTVTLKLHSSKESKSDPNSSLGSPPGSI
jgi:hypothetical protein